MQVARSFLLLTIVWFTLSGMSLADTYAERSPSEVSSPEFYSTRKPPGKPSFGH